jgi:hypothetical protein
MTMARRGTTAARTSAAVVLGVLTALVALSVVVAPAAQAVSYRYWTYWSGERPGTAAAWTFSSRGPASDVVKDGTVVGWRFAVTAQAGTTKPRASAALASLCPDLADPVADRTRVALVVDYGTTADAPPGQQPPLTDRVRVECLTIAGSRVTGATVLDEAGIAVRTENGLLCALDSYPRGECAPVVGSPGSRPTASPTPKPTRTASAAPSPARSSAAAAPSSARSSSTAASPAGTASAAVAPTPSSSPTAGTASTSAAPSPEETLPTVAGAPATSASEQSSAAGFVGGALLVAGIGAAAWWTSRRRGEA